jgi:hypothetical protein
MRKSSELICALILAGALGTSAVAQDQAPSANDTYDLWLYKIKNGPEQTYGPCREYLERMHPRDGDVIDSWVADYEKAIPYMQYLKDLAPDGNAPWLVYEPDEKINLPETPLSDGRFKVEISRVSSNPNEEKMLRTAEAVYLGPSNMVAQVCRSFQYWAQQPLGWMEPIWGMLGNDNIEQTSVVTAKAVRYYYDLSLAERVDPRLPTGFTAENSELEYKASIQHFEQYSHSGHDFTNVNVANLTLQWSFSCGGLCGMGFTRNKLVVLDDAGNVVALFLDAPENSSSWVA